ncbi:ThiF family adenylyltransferase [Trujillonella endophytica]|uniref:ThiF family protein n=1 Tax=Trujillonella endophytica TaxID=673521 RepID=A0A1H8S0H6_9ACTN|nr:ThiF family adenylyltransferase [Trujillella endophytica]SEO72449.1 ThiF family protein [Trujillella endophytica]
MSDTDHPLLPPATPLLLRAADTVQVGGVDSGVGLVVRPGAAELTALLRGLDGRRPQRAVLTDAAESGFDPAAVAGLLDGLRTAGLLVDLDAADLLAADAGPAAAARTTAELPAVRGHPGGRPRWAARRRATVLVEGATRVGVPLASVLAASGVGRVCISDRGPALAADAVVGGLRARDEGRPRALAAADAVRRASPLADVRPLPEGTTPDLVVLARPWAAADPLATGWQRSGIVHVVATVRGETGVVGPLVVPGRTSCLRCADLRRRDADPSWPALAAQLTAGEVPPSGSTITCLLTAVTAAQQVLAYLDGSGAPAALGATVELRPPDLVPVRRPWAAHPECGCLAAPGRSAATPSGDSRGPALGARETVRGQWDQERPDRGPLRTDDLRPP